MLTTPLRKYLLILDSHAWLNLVVPLIALGVETRPTKNGVTVIDPE